MRFFPFVLGTDIVHLKRWDPKPNPQRIVRLAQRLLHPTEFYALNQKHPTIFSLLRSPAVMEDLRKHQTRTVIDSQNERPAVWDSKWYTDQLTSEVCERIRTFLGGRWAAKEAARKAWGADIVGFKDLRVVSTITNDANHRDKNPTATKPVKIVCQPFSVSHSNETCQEGRLSISHDGDYVIATVIAEPLESHMGKILAGTSLQNEP